MYIKRFILACIASAVLFSTTAQAATEVLPMPRVVPGAKFDVKRANWAVYGSTLVFRGELTNLQGRKVKIETYLCDKDGNYLTFEKQQEIISTDYVTPASHGDTWESSRLVSADIIRQLYGSQAQQYYVRRVIKDASTDELLAVSQTYVVANKLPPQSPLAPRS